jgi:hypothetical protein
MSEQSVANIHSECSNQKAQEYSTIDQGGPTPRRPLTPTTGYMSGSTMCSASEGPDTTLAWSESAEDTEMEGEETEGAGTPSPPSSVDCNSRVASPVSGSEAEAEAEA